MGLINDMNKMGINRDLYKLVMFNDVVITGEDETKSFKSILDNSKADNLLGDKKGIFAFDKNGNAAIYDGDTYLITKSKRTVEILRDQKGFVENKNLFVLDGNSFKDDKLLKQWKDVEKADAEEAKFIAETERKVDKSGVREVLARARKKIEENKPKMKIIKNEKATKKDELGKFSVPKKSKEIA